MFRMTMTTLMLMTLLTSARARAADPNAKTQMLAFTLGVQLASAAAKPTDKEAFSRAQTVAEPFGITLSPVTQDVYGYLLGQTYKDERKPKLVAAGAQADALYSLGANLTLLAATQEGTAWHDRLLTAVDEGLAGVDAELATPVRQLVADIRAKKAGHTEVGLLIKRLVGILVDRTKG